jgi:hypothetical protein
LAGWCPSPGCGSKEARTRSTRIRSAHLGFITERKAPCHVHHDRNRPTQGIPHRCRDRPRRTRPRRDPSENVEHPNRPAPMLGRQLRRPDVGSRVRPRTWLSACPATRRCRRSRARRSRSASVTNPDTEFRTVTEERPQRRPLSRDRSAASRRSRTRPRR